MLTTRVAVVAMLLLLSLSVAGQSAPIFPRETKRVQLKRYINDVLAFELSYPASYRREDSPVPSPPFFGDHVELSDGGNDFASTVGVGGVVGTQFVLPPLVEKRSKSDLTPARENGAVKREMSELPD